MALCIRPDMFGHSKSDIVEFIGFHQVVGVTDFIAYDIGIQDGILTKLKMLEGLPSFVRSFSVLAWNFPFEDSALSVKALELDCILRTSGRVRVMGIVSWDHYIVPNRKVTILSSLANFGRKKTVLLNLLVQICCLNMKDDKHSEKTWPLVLRKTRCTSVSKEGTLVVNPRLREGGQRTIRPLSNVMSWYHECNESQKAMSSYDVRPSRFLDSIISNELLKLWKSGILFGDTV
ncbi:hypothetical protein AAG570_007939 [Ranatra chinensis]|uniref:Glycosyltransferase family 92 protein n=1 Tax=Ranatra chinensis TaxID=642074 RepID=A0ABD0XTF7_9HEMI